MHTQTDSQGAHETQVDHFKSTDTPYKIKSVSVDTHRLLKMNSVCVLRITHIGYTNEFRECPAISTYRLQVACRSKQLDL